MRDLRRRQRAWLPLRVILLFAMVTVFSPGAAQQVASLEWPSAWLPLNTSASNDDSLTPALAIPVEDKTDGTTSSIFLIWVEQARTISLKASTDNGDKFDPQGPLPQSNQPVYSPVIAAQSSGAKLTLFVAWEEGPPGMREVYLSQSINGGKSFSIPVNLSRTPGADSHSPDMAPDGQGGIYIVWVDALLGDEEIFLQHFTRGELLSTPLNVSRTSTPSLNPSLAVAQGQIYVAWEEDNLRGNREILFQSSAPFSAPMNLSNSPRLSQNPDLAADEQGRLYLVWEEETGGGNIEIFFQRSIDDPDPQYRALLPPVFMDVPFNLSNNPLPSRSPAIAVVSRGEGRSPIIVVVSEEGGEIFLRNSNDTFQSPINLSRSPSLSRDPAIATFRELVAVAWAELLNNNWEILSITNKASTPADLIKALQDAKPDTPDAQIHAAQAVEYARGILGANPESDFRNEVLALDEIFAAGLGEKESKDKAINLLERTKSVLTEQERRNIICNSGIWAQLGEQTRKELKEKMNVTCQ